MVDVDCDYYDYGRCCVDSNGNSLKVLRECNKTGLSKEAREIYVPICERKIHGKN